MKYIYNVNVKMKIRKDLEKKVDKIRKKLKKRK